MFDVASELGFAAVLRGHTILVGSESPRTIDLECAGIDGVGEFPERVVSTHGRSAFGSLGFLLCSRIVHRDRKMSIDPVNLTPIFGYYFFGCWIKLLAEWTLKICVFDQ